MNKIESFLNQIIAEARSDEKQYENDKTPANKGLYEEYKAKREMFEEIKRLLLTNKQISLTKETCDFVGVMFSSFVNRLQEQQKTAPTPDIRAVYDKNINQGYASWKEFEEQMQKLKK